MATVTAVKTGNWSDTTVWDTGALPQSGDTVRAATYTVTINQDIDIGSGTLESNSTGGFSVTAACTIVANLSAGVVMCLTCSHSSGTVAITGNVTGGSGNFAYGVNNAAAGTVTITGNVTGGSGGWAYGVNNNAAGTVTITGNATGGSGNNAYGVNNAAAGTVAVTGNATGGSGNNAYGVNNAAAGTVTITGNATGGSGGAAYGVNNNAAGTVTITGNATGGSGGAAYGVNNNAAGTVTITGNATGGSGNNAYGAGNITAGTLAVMRAVGNDWGPSGTHPNSNAGLYGSNNAAAVTTVRQVQYGARGQAPTAGAVRLVPDSANNQATFIRSDTLAALTLTDPSTPLGFPAVGDVRYGTSYKGGDMVGTLRVPTAGQVALGVLVDNTTGTAVLTLANVQSALDAQGYTAARAAYIDAPISEAGGGGGGLDAAELRAAVGLASANLDTQLAAIDDFLDTEIAAIKAKTDTIGAVSMVVQSPATATGTITVYQGDDYNVSDSRQIAFTFTNAPSITGATVTFVVPALGVSIALTVTASDAAYLQLTKLQTAAMRAGYYDYQIDAALATSGRVVTLATGTLVVNS